jgi:hypothetical protein
MYIGININMKLSIILNLTKTKHITRENRVCHLCNESIGHEFQYLFICNFPYLLNCRK